MRDVAVVAYQLTVPVLSLPLFHQLKGYVFQLYIQQSKSTLLFCFVHPPSESLRRHVRLSHERKSPRSSANGFEKDTFAYQWKL